MRSAVAAPWWVLRWLGRRAGLLRRLLPWVNGSETLSGRSVELWYDPTLKSRPDLATHLERWEAALAENEQVFGLALPRTVLVLLFATGAEADRTFGSAAYGRALAARSIAVGAELLDEAHSEETIRHELAHLFSRHWGPLRPPLKAEGLAEWLSRTRDGVGIDVHALGYLLLEEEGKEVRLSRLLDPDLWTKDRLRSYALAGSFTGFLIRRFGWSAYRQFFARARQRNFESVFAEAFDRQLDHVEFEWRRDLLSRRLDLEPELSRLLGERRLEEAYDRREFLRCLEEIDKALHDGYATARALWFGASAHRALHNHRTAIELLERALRMDDGWLRRHRARAWLELGQLYDMDGRGEAAGEAFRRVLEEAPGGADGDAVRLEADEALHRPSPDESA